MMRDSRFAVLLFLTGALCLGVTISSSADTGTITKEARETVKAVKEYTIQQKETFQRVAHEELTAVQTQITLLQGKVRDMSASARADLQESINELEKKRDMIQDQLNKMQTEADEKWHIIRSSVETTIEELKDACRKVMSRVP
ncbi:MAG: hypothetical protein LDL14_10800 [Nitrospira sp.]|nr:hypothetical protein [Nitrospira sp.]